jgi:hypothetical protein
MIQPITTDPTVERFLPLVADVLGADLPAYRHHIYRVMSYARHFLGENQRGQDHIAFALVFHDIGMWTEGELAYLTPSEQRAEQVRAAQAPHLDAALIAKIIHWHHKLLPYRGTDADIINAARKADWIDASQGLIRHGLPRASIRAVEAAIPVLGFHSVLMRLAKELGQGSRLAGLWRVLSHVYKL